VDPRLLHRGDQRVALGDVAADSGEAYTEQLRGIVTLHRVHVRLGVVRLVVTGPERLVLGVRETVRVVQRREQPLRGFALRLERAVGEEARAVQRDRLVEARGRVILDELDGAASR